MPTQQIYPHELNKIYPFSSVFNYMYKHVILNFFWLKSKILLPEKYFYFNFKHTMSERKEQSAIYPASLSLTWQYWRVFQKGTQPWCLSTPHWYLNSRASLIIWHCKDYPLLLLLASIYGGIVHNLSYILYPADTVWCYDPHDRNFQQFPAPSMEKWCILFVLNWISTSCIFLL